MMKRKKKINQSIKPPGSIKEILGEATITWVPPRSDKIKISMVRTQVWVSFKSSPLVIFSVRPAVRTVLDKGLWPAVGCLCLICHSVIDSFSWTEVS